MAGIGATKLKLLYIKDYLERFSDEQNPVGAEELLEMLEEKGIHCERKAVYSDVQTLRNADLEIFRVKAPKNGYYLATRTFELPELRLLIDAVQAANFITPKKSKELIEKIGTLFGILQIFLTVAVKNSVDIPSEQLRVHFSHIYAAVFVAVDIADDHRFFLPRLLAMAIINRVSFMGYNPLQRPHSLVTGIFSTMSIRSAYAGSLRLSVPITLSAIHLTTFTAFLMIPIWLS